MENFRGDAITLRAKTITQRYDKYYFFQSPKTGYWIAISYVNYMKIDNTLSYWDEEYEDFDFTVAKTETCVFKEDLQYIFNIREKDESIFNEDFIKILLVFNMKVKMA